MPTSFYSSTSSCSVADLADVDLAGDVSKTATNAATAAATIAVQLDAQHQKKSPSLDELCRLTRFSRQEVRAFYRTLKQVTFLLLYRSSNLTRILSLSSPT